MEKLYFILIFFVLVSCQPKKIMTVDQIPSNEKVQIYFDVRNPNKDSVNISIPLEYKLFKKQKKIYSLGITFISNKKDLEELRDFRIYNKVNHKLLYATVELTPDEIPENLIITENDIRISRKEAQELLLKYDINKDISQIKDLDTINLIAYNQFKKDNPAIIKKIKKINDSIIFRVRDGKNPKSFIIAKKIDW